MGMQFFAGKIKFNEDGQYDSNGISPRYNFDNFGNAFLAIFIIFTGENWNEMMYSAMLSTTRLASIYFIIVIVLGNIIILQLLVAIVLSNFDESRKLTAKRKIIDEIESNLIDGKSIQEAVQVVLGKDFIINGAFDGQESLKKLKIIHACSEKFKCKLEVLIY